MGVCVALASACSPGLVSSNVLVVDSWPTNDVVHVYPWWNQRIDRRVRLFVVAIAAITYHTMIGVELCA